MASIHNEIVYSRNFSKKVGGLLDAVETLKSVASEKGEFRVARERILHSAGRKNIDIAFDVIRKTDGISSLVAMFTLSGNKDRMDIKLSGNIQTIIGKDEKTFNSFYMKNIYPSMSGELKLCAKDFFSRIEKEIDSL